jgi:hypothetical protein
MVIMGTTEKTYYSLDGSVHLGDAQLGDVEIEERPSQWHDYTPETGWVYNKHRHAVAVELTPWMFTKVLKAAGLFQTVRDAMLTNEEALDAYNRSTKFVRTDELLVTMAVALGISEEQLDDLFISGEDL